MGPGQQAPPAVLSRTLAPSTQKPSWRMVATIGRQVVHLVQRFLGPLQSYCPESCPLPSPPLCSNARSGEPLALALWELVCWPS